MLTTTEHLSCLTSVDVLLAKELLLAMDVLVIDNLSLSFNIGLMHNRLSNSLCHHWSFELFSNYIHSFLDISRMRMLFLDNWNMFLFN